MKLAKGYRGARSRRYKTANEAVMHALSYAYQHRRTKKRDFRRLWISRINAAVRNFGLSYSRFLEGIKKAGVLVDRKILADIATEDMSTFKELAELARQHSQH